MQKPKPRRAAKPDLQLTLPRPVSTFVGRDVELARALRLFETEPLHIVYGVAGIGKTEFVFKAVEQAQLGRPCVMVSLREGDTSEAALVAIAAALGQKRAKTSFATGASVDLDAEVAAIADTLERSPVVLFIDNAQHIVDDLLARWFSYWVRRVRASLIIVASRKELPLVPDGPMWAVHRLAPLSSTDTAALVGLLAERLGTPVPDSGQVYLQSGGSPFFVVRTVAGGGQESGLSATLATLTPIARETLLMVAVAQAAIQTSDLARVALQEAASELASKFLIDDMRSTMTVHDLVRDQVVTSASQRDIRIAHRGVADLIVGRGDAMTPPDIAAVVHHLVLAAEPDEAWDLVRRDYRKIAHAGLDHVLLPDLRWLADQLHGTDKHDATVLIARILIRRSHISKAAEVLATIGDRGAEASVRWLFLAGEVASRLAQFGQAQTLFQRALHAAKTKPEQLHAALALADAMSLTGEGSQARGVLATALAEHEPMTPRDKGRWAWSLAVSYILQEFYWQGVEATRIGAKALQSHPSDDLAVMLAMLEVLGLCASDQIDDARALLERYEAMATSSGALRRQVLVGYRGLVEYHAGNLVLAATLLAQSYEHLAGHSDHVLAVMAGYFRVQAGLALGQGEFCVELATRLAKLAVGANLPAWVSHGRAMQASALLLAGRTEQARSLAETALESPSCFPAARFLAVSTLAEIAALEGDLPTARQWSAMLATITLGDTALLPALDLRIAIDKRSAAQQLQVAWLELLGGDATAAADAAASAAHHYQQTHRVALQNRATALRALALIARAEPRDESEADVLLDGAVRAAAAARDVRTLALCKLGHAALAKRRTASGLAMLAAVPAELMPELAGQTLSEMEYPEGRALRAARGELTPPPGIRALLALLGLVATGQHSVVSKRGKSQVSDAELSALREQFSVVVEPERAVITARIGQELRVDRGRPLACELLAALVEAQGAVCSAEQLFLAVWGGREYHPLRHRNTVYVAVKRLRTTLNELLGVERDYIETTAGGWRVGDALSALVLRAAA